MTDIRDAASLLLLKNTHGHLSVLMGMRHANHKFMPSRIVFPGGKVDLTDFTAAVASPLSAPTQAKLERAASPELAQALGVACARELHEETGLSLGDPPTLGGLAYLCRAVTPPDHSIRFNARFFIADAASATGTLAGSGELEALGWYALDELINLKLAGATRAVLDQLKIWLALSDAERLTRATPVLLDRGWQNE